VSKFADHVQFWTEIGTRVHKHSTDVDAIFDVLADANADAS